MSAADEKPVETDEELWARLNGEVTKIAWLELQRPFARGVVMRVSSELDLVRVAMAVVRDRREVVEAWARTGAIAAATDDDARRWLQADELVWAVVAAPWVLVQEIPGLR